MKKFLLSLTVVAVSAVYVFYENLGPASPQATQGAAALTQATTTVVRDATPVAATPPPTPAPVPTPAPTPTPTPTPTPAPAPAPKPKGQYADGTYTGSTENAFYGMVQVQATVAGGKLADVTFLQYPSDRSTSRYINGQAMGYLKEEALQAQSANVDIISGATDTSLAFQQSLATALAAAKNS